MLYIDEIWNAGIDAIEACRVAISDLPADGIAHIDGEPIGDRTGALSVRQAVPALIALRFVEYKRSRRAISG